MPIDPALIEALRVERFEEEDVIGALHVELLERKEVRGDEPHHHALFQTSTVEALLDGNYDGELTFAELAVRGDFGLGTFDALDGEMIGLDGAFYQVKADGRAYEVDEQARTPFAVVTFFEPGRVEKLDGPIDYAALRAHLDRNLADPTTVYAVRLDGGFDYVKTRSVPRQRKPYPPLIEVVEHQPTFEFRHVRGSLVGFRFPDYTGGLNVAGYHFHFITEDKSAGGHLLECRISHGELRVDHESDLELELPEGVQEAVSNLSASQEEALRRVENE
jgi:acetolactate decarboxylase